MYDNVTKTRFSVSHTADIFVMQVSKEEMTVVWAPPENDGGKSITGYILERKEKRAVRWVPCTKSPISERRMKVTNLIPNHEYQFRVKAENEVGLGEPSKPCRPVAAKDPIGEYKLLSQFMSLNFFFKICTYTIEHGIYRKLKMSVMFM